MQTITAQELHERLDDGDDILVVNVLSRESYEQEHIPGSISIPEEEIEEEAPNALPDKDATIIVHCSGETCSASENAAKKLEAMDYENVIRFEGGIEAWKEAGYELESEDEENETTV